ncbi:unnamed protein product [Echinostoma caproni]|uniref:RRM domain-containing protein n=1 Tax=Echinostoma caproni TaxID=27848 RepID=A0A183B7I9_9TREM|nr:unnamed protein product [Echinostoma caproni]
MPDAPVIDGTTAAGETAMPGVGHDPDRPPDPGHPVMRKLTMGSTRVKTAAAVTAAMAVLRPAVHLPDAVGPHRALAPLRHEDLRRAFGRYGHILDITIPLDYFTGRMKGYAFIEYPFCSVFQFLLQKILICSRCVCLLGDAGNCTLPKSIQLFNDVSVLSLTICITFEDPRDAEDAHYNMDHARFMGRDIEVEFTRGYRKTPAEMRLKERREDGRSSGPGRRRRSRSRSHTSRRGRDQYARRSSDRRDDSRRRNSNARGGSRSRSPTRSRSPSHEEVDNGVDSRKDSRRSDRRDGRASSRSPPPRRRGSASRSRSGSY